MGIYISKSACIDLRRATLAALLLLQLSWLVSVTPAFSDDTASQPTDNDSTSATGIRQNYFKRFPFAANSASADTVDSNGQSASGTPINQSGAYAQVIRNCLQDNNSNEALTADAASVAGMITEDLGTFDFKDATETTNDTLNGVNNLVLALTYESLNSVQDSSNNQAAQESANIAYGLVGVTAVAIKFGLPSEDSARIAAQGTPGQGAATNTETSTFQSLSKSLNSLISDLSSCVPVNNPSFLIQDYQPTGFGANDIHYSQDSQPTVVQTVLSQRENAALNTGWIPCQGYPISDTQFQLIDRENRQRLLELFFDPERWMWARLAGNQMQAAAASNSLGGNSETAFQTAIGLINNSLFNVANENAALGDGSSIAYAVQIVQQAYKSIFLPMALLLVLPGALLTQLKGLLSYTMLGSRETTSPYEGILRSLMAIFLIPATQLIISYCIDIGNSMAYCISNPSQQWIQPTLLENWATQQAFHPSPTNNNNAIASVTDIPPAQSSTPTDSSGGGTGNLGSQISGALGSLSGAQSTAGGKAQGTSSEYTINENQTDLSVAMQTGFNMVSYGMSSCLTVLASYQLVVMCYLLLLGPIAAAFVAWPSGAGSLFRNVFGSWLNGVVVLSLWRFYWSILLAVATQRLVWLNPNANSPGEMITYNCFLALMMYIPFQPFNFNPGPVIAQLMYVATQGSQAGAAPAGGAGASTTGAGNTEQDTKSGATGKPEQQSSTTQVSGGPSDTAQGQNTAPDGREGGSSNQSSDAPGRRIGEPPPLLASGTPQPGNTPSPGIPGAASFTTPANNQAEAAAKQVWGIPNLSSVAPGAPPTVALGSSPGSSNYPSLVLNTNNPALAVAGTQSWQQAGFSPGQYSGGNSLSMAPPPSGPLPG